MYIRKRLLPLCLEFASGVLGTIHMNGNTVMPLPHDSRGVGVAEMAWAIRTGRPARTDAGFGLHCLDVLYSLQQSSITGTFCRLSSSCSRPAALPPGFQNIPVITYEEEGALVN